MRELYDENFVFNTHSPDQQDSNAFQTKHTSENQAN